MSDDDLRRALSDLIDAKQFGVAVPGAREKDPTHNGCHEVVLVSDLRALLAAHPVTSPRGVELTCDDCAQPYAVWFTNNEVWNLVMGGPDTKGDPGGMLCPRCFQVRAEGVYERPIWSLRLDRVNGEKQPEPVASPAGQDEGAVIEHDHPGMDCSQPFAYCGPCRECGVCKFIGHGPLCMDCYLRPAPAVDEEAGDE